MRPANDVPCVRVRTVLITGGIAVVVLASTSGFGFLGAWTGDSLCTDDPDEVMFACMGEVMGGMFLGGIVGLTVGYIGAVAFARWMRGRGQI